MIMNIARMMTIWVGMVLPLLMVRGQSVRAEPALAAVSQASIDAYIEDRMRELQIPGLAIGIVRGDQIAYLRGYGAADGDGRLLTHQTPLLIASMSKSFTALGVMQLVEEGKLDLDAPVQETLPWFRVADPEASSQLTIRHLLHQTSGFSELEGYQRNLEGDRGDGALEASVLRLRESKLNAPPGERFEYSNTNYDLLGLLIQVASGQPYETYIEEKIFAPLNMRNSYTSLDEARRGGVSRGYSSFFGRTVENDRFMPYSRTVVPSAGLFSSAEDMARYLIAHLNQGQSQDGTVVLSPAGMAALHAPGVNIGENVSYGMGWTVFPFPQAAAAGGPSPIALSHGGDWANFKSLMLLVPEQGLGVVVLMNKKGPAQDAAYNEIAWNTALLALGLEPVDFPRSEDFLTRYGRLILAIITLLLFASFFWSVRWLFGRSSRDGGEARGRGRTLAWMVVLLLLDLSLSGYLLFVQLPRSVTTLPLALYFEPDVGLMYLLILAFTLGWGALRTILAIKRLVVTGRVTTVAY